MDTPFTIDRPPRIQPELPVDEIEIPAPPEQETNGWMRILQVGLPLITIVGYLIIAAVGGGGRRPIYMIPMAMAMIASVIFSIYTYRREQQELAEMRRRYDAHLIKLSKEMRAHHDAQRRFYHHNYPDLDRSLRIVKETIDEARTRGKRALRSRARLWERRVADDDFGVVRLGLGTLPSTVIYVLQDADPLSDDPQMRAAMKLDEDSRYVSDIPAIAAMRNAGSDDPLSGESEEASILAPVAHAVGVAGEKQAVYSYVRALLAQFTIFHAPMDARLYVLADHQKPWLWAETLPHASGDEQTRQCCFLDTIRKAGSSDGFDFDEEGELEQFLEQIRKMLAQRKLRLENSDNTEEKSDAASVTQPFQLIVVDMLDAAHAQESPLTEIESDAAISIILDEGQRLGAAVLFLAPERSKIPSKCQAVVEIERTKADANRKIQRAATLHFRYAETGVNTTRYIGRADHIARTNTVDELTKALAGCRVRKSFGAEIASSVPFLDMMGYDSLRALQQDLAHRWPRSIEQANSDWLRAKLGLMSGNKTRTLAFSAKRDGVHGMVAGSTGSGKSELLISLITGMAVSYDPTMLNFVLVDFKGGGAFDAFRELPHCVNVITNLNQDGVTRMFTAIRSEMLFLVMFHTIMSSAMERGPS